MEKKVDSKKTRRVYSQDRPSVDCQKDDQVASSQKKQGTALKGDKVVFEFFITAEDIKRRKPTKKYEFVEVNKSDDQQVSKMDGKDDIKNATDGTPVTVASNDNEEVKVVIKEEPTNEYLEVSGTNNDSVQSKTSSTRSEDDIYGEWVAAMLKNQTDQQKKRDMKKKIMNELLS